MKDPLYVVSVSGGKDSTALYLWALEKFGKDGFISVFADTGHEHPVTYNYVRNLPLFTKGPSIQWVKADFAEKVAKKGETPSGIPFLDLILWKGRVPSKMAQFCTPFLKLEPVKKWLETVRGDAEVIMLTGIRRAESEKRSHYAEREWHSLYDCETWRPLIDWTEEQVFKMHRAHGIEPNPLYKAGFGRVGCFPCINAGKRELSRLPKEAWDKIRDWENRVGRSWFSAGKVPGLFIPTVDQVKEWSTTSRGGYQQELMPPEVADVPSCMATWGTCE